MIFGEGLFGLVVLGFWTWAIFDVIASDRELVRNLPKFGWLFLVVFLSTIGALAWLVLGRPRRVADPSPRTRYVAPEDDPRWAVDHRREERYAAMDDELDRRIEERRRREAEVQRREEDPSV
jgi:hypothetical protein